jgi:uncharacterized protein (DUF1499 family)
MVRRLIVDEPPSRLAIWSWRLVLFALAVAFLAVVLARGGFVETVPAFVILAAGLALAALGIVFALAGLIVIWFNGNPGAGKAMLALLLGGALVAWPGYLGVQSYGLPMISDVTTNTADPPRFEVIARLRPRGANALDYPGAETAQKQQAAWPDIGPLAVAATPAEAFAGALDVVARRKWSIVETRTPQAGRRDGRIEAVALTPVMGFRDDVVIRVRAAAGGAVVDIRSASRYGRFDFGSNARRVRSLSEEIEEEVGTQAAAATR